MREQLLRGWLVLCVVVVIGGAAWWALRGGWPGQDGADASDADVVLLEQHIGAASDGNTVRIIVGVLATDPDAIRDRPERAGIDVGLTVGATSSRALHESGGHDDLRRRLLHALQTSYPDAGIERVLVTDLLIGPPPPEERIGEL